MLLSSTTTTSSGHDSSGPVALRADYSGSSAHGPVGLDYSVSVAASREAGPIGKDVVEDIYSMVPHVTIILHA